MELYNLVSSSSDQTVPWSLVSGSLDQLKDLSGLDGFGTFLAGRDTGAGGGGAGDADEAMGGGAGAAGGGGGPGGAGGGGGGAGRLEWPLTMFNPSAWKSGICII